MQPISFRARWVFPVATPPIRDGMIEVHEGRIARVGPANAGDSAAGWEDVAIIPALVNAHTHLEFSGLQQPLGVRGMPFPEWIRCVVAWHRARMELGGWEQSVGAIRQGLKENLKSGVGTLGEIAGSPMTREILEASDLGGVAFLELIGLSATRRDELLVAARNYGSENPIHPTNTRTGISPHAPYTVHPDLLAGIARLSAERRFPVAMHLAESKPELQLLRDQAGPFVDLLQELNAWDPRAISRGSRPLDYLRVLAQADRALVIHGNFLDGEEVRFLGERSQHMSIVYCPRTHLYFAHPPYPLTELLDAGVRVALGTDSRASNPDLSLWEELRFAAARHPQVSPEAWLRIATLNGAEALGLGNQVGGLEKGKAANFLVVSLPAGSHRDPWEWMAGDCRVRQVFIGGIAVWSDKGCEGVGV